MEMAAVSICLHLQARLSICNTTLSARHRSQCPSQRRSSASRSLPALRLPLPVAALLLLVHVHVHVLVLVLRLVLLSCSSCSSCSSSSPSSSSSSSSSSAHVVNPFLSFCLSVLLLVTCVLLLRCALCCKVCVCQPAPDVPLAPAAAVDARRRHHRLRDYHYSAATQPFRRSKPATSCAPTSGRGWGGYLQMH